MKHITIYMFIAAMIIFGNATKAQNPDVDPDKQEGASSSDFTNKGLYLGLRGAPHLSWMLNKDDADNNNYETLAKFGAGFGLGAGYNFTENMGIGLDVLYAVQGKRYNLNKVEYNQRLDYIKIPLMFTFVTNPGQVMFIGKIGPQLNILTTADIDPAIVNGGVISDNKDHFENLVFGGVLSAGARYAVTDKLWLDAAIRFDATFTDVEDKAYVSFPAGRANTYNMTPGIEIGANYLIK